MNTLHTVRASQHDYRCDAGYAGIDLFTCDDVYVSLQTDLIDVRRTLDQTHCNMVRIVTDTPDRTWLALIANWPYPWHACRLTLNEIAEDEEVRLFARVTIENLPDSILRGELAFVRETPWIQVCGTAKDACEPVVATFSDPAQRELRAGDLVLPPGVVLATPSEQVLFRLQEVPASREAALA